MPESNFMQRREVTVDSYTESISSNDESSDDRTILLIAIVLLHKVSRMLHVNWKLTQKQ